MCLRLYLFVWFGCVLDGAQGLSLVLQFVIQLTEFSSSIAGLLVDSFTAFVTHFLYSVQTLALRTEIHYDNNN